jgi:hypothetical protein
MLSLGSAAGRGSALDATGATPTRPGAAPPLAEGHQTRRQKFQKGVDYDQASP